MNSDSTTDQPPSGSLFRGRACETRKPHQRYRNNSSIDYADPENPFADPPLNENTFDIAEMTVPVASSNPVSSFVLNIVYLGSVIVFPPSLLIALYLHKTSRL